MISIKTIGGAAVLRRITRSKAKLQNRSTMFKAATVFVQGWIQKNFKSDGRMSMGGRGWKKLKASTIKARRKGGAGAKILRDMGTLRQSFKATYNNVSGVVFNNLPYANTHNYGDKSRNIPERRMMPLRKQVLKELKAISKRFIKRSIV